MADGGGGTGEQGAAVRHDRDCKLTCFSSKTTSDKSRIPDYRFAKYPEMLCIYFVLRDSHIKLQVLTFCNICACFDFCVLQFLLYRGSVG